jgi:hypothetical protein
VKVVNIVRSTKRVWIRGEDREVAGILAAMSEPATQQSDLIAIALSALQDHLLPPDVMTLPLIRARIKRAVKLNGSFKVPSLKVFWIDEWGSSHFSNDCLTCGHKIVQIARKNRFSVKFMCNPAHRIGGRRSDVPPSFFIFSDAKDCIFKAPLEVVS